MCWEEGLIVERTVKIKIESQIWPLLFNEEFFVLKPLRLAMEAHYVYNRKKLCEC